MLCSLKWDPLDALMMTSESNDSIEISGAVISRTREKNRFAGSVIAPSSCITAGVETLMLTVRSAFF